MLVHQRVTHEIPSSGWITSMSPSKTINIQSALLLSGTTGPPPLEKNTSNYINSTKAGWARRYVYWRNMCGLPFGVADTLTAVYLDILAHMHHTHSTTLPLISWHASVNITLLVPYLPKTKCPNRAHFGWATLQPSDWTSFPRPVLSLSVPPRWINKYICIYTYYIYIYV